MDPRNVAMDDAQQFPSQVPISQAADQQTPRKCLTIEELSQWTGLSVSTIRRRVKDGTIPFLQPGGRRSRIVFPPDIVERLIQITSQKSTNTEPIAVIPPEKPQRRGPRPKWQREMPP
jgi:excisionase family DNA binding protein